MKKNLTLISLMLSVILLIAVSGIVSAVVSDNNCILCPENPRPCEDVDLCTWTTDTGHQDCGLPLGSGYYAGCPLLDNHNTYWPTGSQGNPSLATATCVFDGTNLEDAMLYLSIDNDIINCTLNGVEVVNFTGHEGCAPLDPRVGGFSEDIYSEVQPGNNTLICTVQDRGVMSHFDACVVAEEEPEPEECSLIITDPYEGQWFDSEPVPIKWWLSSGCTSIVYSHLYYRDDGTCNPGEGWKKIESDVPSDDTKTSVPYHHEYLWDSPPNSGQYCVYVEVHSSNVKNYSKIFNVDLAKPYVNLSVGEPRSGDCSEDETKDCYVNNQTEITLTCHDDNPNEDWQSGVKSISYDITGPSGSGVVTTDGDSVTFTFPQDSTHGLEYWCEDNVGKISYSKFKTFLVDSVAPEITKEVREPKVLGCNDPWACDWYVTQNTKICLSAVDPEPHPVGGVEIFCEYTWWNQDPRHNNAVGTYPITLDEYGCFTYGEDSWHVLHCWATDALENTAHLYENDIVDTEAPITSHKYIGPYYCEGELNCETSEVCWIDGVTLVELDAYDPEPHPVGLYKTYYRYKIVNDGYCLGQTLNGYGYEWEEGFTEYTGQPFGIPEESCHVIEYYSVDLLGNSEEIKHTFVFVDKTVPKTIKEVGKPSVNCSKEYCSNPSWDWIVTLDTVIELSCVDQEPHPSGVQKICYRIEWDGEDVTEQECAGTIENGYCCINSDKANVQFIQPCEHLLEFYCVDNVDKTSPVDSELFKVEGKKFDLVIGKKWDLISVPFYLLNDNVEDVFSDDVDKLEGIWTYYGGTWYVYSPEGPNTLEKMKPGYGYWVKSKEDITLTLGGSLFKPGVFVPPQRELEAGWNLIGHYGHDSKTVEDALDSLKWISIIEYNPDLLVQDFFTPTDMNAGRGYWIALTESGLYMPTY